MILTLMCALFFFPATRLVANGFAQGITIVKNDVRLSEVFRSIEKQSGFLFFYDKSLIREIPPMDVRIRNATVEEALATCLKNQPLTYSIVQNTIVIQPKKEPAAPAKVSVQAPQPPPPAEITGTVVDRDNKPLPGVSVVVAGTRTGTSTRSDGSFTLTVPGNAEVVLEFSSVGYQTKTVRAGSGTPVTVILEEDVAGLNKIVVIGYGAVRKSDVTGSVASVSRKELNAYPVADAVMGLQGKTTGVRVVQNSGAPGAPVTVRIRGGNSLLGSNEPLYVVDGFPLTTNPNSINPNDIESIEVLKDASATAIYGSRGANGVVIITTKRGRAGRSEVTFDSYSSIQQVAKTIPMMNAREFAELANERAANDGFPAYFTDEQVKSFGTGTNWQEELFRSAPMQNHSVNVTGGSEFTQYSVSGNYLNQVGVIEGSGLKRISLRANLNQRISEKFSVLFNATLTNSDLTQIDINGQKGGTVLSAVLVAPPTVSPYDANGNFNNVRIYPFSPNELRNPLAMARERDQKANAKYILAGTAVNYEPVKNLVFKSSFGVENTTSREDIYSSRVLDNTPTGQANITALDWVNLLNENTVNYTRALNADHNLSLLGGFTYQQFTSRNFGTGNITGFPTDQLETNNLSSGSVPGTPVSGAAKWSILSYLGRVNYSIRNTYLFTASIRADGSSRFGPGNKWGYFPSAAVAWRAGNENFIKDIGSISDLKFRLSWGVTGSTAVDPYQTLNSLSSFRTAFNDQLYIGYAPNSSNLANPDLKWETTAQVDAGMDLGLLQNRLYLTFDYYHKKTSDLLANSPLPTSSGFTNVIKNIGKIENKGIELGINAKVLNGAFRWDVNANFTRNRSKVLQLSGGSDVFGVAIPQPLAVPVNLVRVGLPVGVFYGYLEDGL
ncbi:MAG TPA: SusC/RagA family TonB-linked outer membrane protein, partial [Chitinophagaceae bacterium]|nr:SusC/RagA family TonB-linked outer membrane protein [Chitinophagaceae bacterium]